MTSSETRRELDRIRSRQYYAAHKDAVRTRIREHAHDKRRHLDEDINQAHVAFEEALLTLQALSGALASSRVSSA